MSTRSRIEKSIALLIASSLMLSSQQLVVADHIDPIELSNILQEGLADWQFWSDIISGPAYTRDPFTIFDCDINGHPTTWRFSNGETDFDTDNTNNSFIRKTVYMRAGDSLWLWGHYWGGSLWWKTYIQVHDPDNAMILSGDFDSNQLATATALKTGTYTVDWRPNPDFLGRQGHWSGHFWLNYGHNEATIPHAECTGGGGDCRPNKICITSSQLTGTIEAIDWNTIKVSWRNGEPFQEIAIADGPDFQNLRSITVVDGTSGTYMIWGLQGSQDYAVKITGYDSNGEIVTTQHVVVKTPPAPVCKPNCLHEDGKPDLVAQILSPLDFEELDKGKRLVVHALIENEGGDMVRKSDVKLSVDGQDLAVKHVGKIKAGNSKSVKLVVTKKMLQGLPEGNHVIGVTADAKHKILEKNENNNAVDITLVVSLEDINPADIEVEEEIEEEAERD